MSRFRHALLVVPVVVAGSVIGATGVANASLPSGVTHLSVTMGANTSNINASLNGAAEISGKITSVAGSKPVFAIVNAYAGQTQVGSGFTDTNGNYSIGGLAKSTAGYAVCVSGSVASGGGSSTGYLGRCYTTAAYSGGGVPSSAHKIPLTSGQHKTGINIALPSGAAISGKVTNSSGTGLNFVFVTARNRSTGASFAGFSSSSGAYSVKGLPASAKGYSVCFRPESTSGLGQLPRCYHNVGWSGGSIPSSATEVKVTPGKTHTKVSQSLLTAGAISGTITDAKTGKPVLFGGVEVFGAKGTFLTATNVNSKGQYVARGLATASADRVCAAPVAVSATVHYNGQCWKARPWSGGKLPSGVTGVSVKTGHTHTGISFKLGKTTTKFGAISGQITEFAGGHPLAEANVTVYTSGGIEVGSAITGPQGNYTVQNLPGSSTGYVVCAQANTGTTSSIPTPDTGWAPLCYTHSAWNGGGLPSGTAKVTVSVGHTHTGIDIKLRVGGVISGVVTSSATNQPIDDVEVELFAGNGHELNSTFSSFDGTYSFTGLSPVAATSTRGYIVCFDGRSTFDTPAGYRPQCYNGVAWNG